MQASIDLTIKKAFPLKKTPECVTTRLQRWIAGGTSLAIACSGGADSVMLVRWCLVHYPQARDRLALLHFNHGIRGEESDGDEAFVVALGKLLGIEVICGRRESVAAQVSEETLREARLGFIRHTMQERGIQILLTGHHAGDRVETMLMRLSRGSTLDGLLAPAPVQTFKNGMVHLRPLLPFGKQEIVATLHAIGQDWREDSSNRNTDYYRNYIRNELLPQWEQACPQKLSVNIGRTCSLLQDDADALNKWAASTVDSIDLDATSFPSSQLNMLPAAIQRRCLWMWFNHHGISDNLSFDLIERLLYAAPNQCFTLSENERIAVDEHGNLQLDTPEPVGCPFTGSYRLSPGSMLCLPDQYCLRADLLPATKGHIESICAGHDNPDHQIHLDADKINFTAGIGVRFWQDGMQYAPLGLGHRRKLQDCFTDRKIPQNKRNRLPVIMNGEGEILWVPGLLPAEKGRITQDSKTLLRLTYLRT